MIVASFFTLGWADSFEGIRAAAEKIHSLEADFVQEKHMRILARPLIDSLVNEVVVHDHAIDRVVPRDPIGCRAVSCSLPASRCSRSRTSVSDW